MAGFKVTRISEGPVKPATATPEETLPLAWVDRYPTHRGLVESMHIFRSGADAAPGMIREALGKALAFFYPLAGRIVEGAEPGCPAIRCTADGVYFAEAEADCSLEDVRFLERPLLLPKEDLVPYPGDDRWGVEPHNTIMMMQVTRPARPIRLSDPALLIREAKHARRVGARGWRRLRPIAVACGRDLPDPAVDLGRGGEARRAGSRGERGQKAPGREGR